MIRLGLMGCGVVASYGHVPAIARTAGAKLVSIFEPDSGRLIDAKDKYKVDRGYTDPELFFQSGLDAVVVTSPAPAHLGNVRLAARYGKPVLCEKPLAMTEAESQQMIDIMVAANLPLYVGFTYRFSPVALGFSPKPLARTACSIAPVGGGRCGWGGCPASAACYSHFGRGG